MSNTVHSIEIRNLWKKYDFFWENLNPDVNILIGINGSGKTTLFNIIDSIMMADVKRLRIYGVGVKITSCILLYTISAGPILLSRIIG